ncbi:hypothetical protein J2X69_002427 [Algoriphagus sp. 4150]|uniref:hypothetical protein n=1 Tax=Algoriphagus sp. 4150 TaxID=2817756 RepID=UPI002863E188|nr:hypothetical protein [Algoriphagus sp. 4150]MDR7130080.1 hypothetical protein [Algoriphagus sp. 4150]
MNELELKLNQNSSIIISSIDDESHSNWNYLSKVNLTFVKNNEKILLGNNVLDSLLIDIKFFFSQLSFSNLELDRKFIDFDVGLYFNIFTYNLRKSISLDKILLNSYLTFEKDLSEPYLLFGGEEFLIWVFNLEKSNIMKITPFYSGLNDLIETKEDFKKMIQWIGSYKIVDEIELDIELINKNISTIEYVYNKISFGMK